MIDPQTLAVGNWILFEIEYKPSGVRTITKAQIKEFTAYKEFVQIETAGDYFSRKTYWIRGTDILARVGGAK